MTPEELQTVKSAVSRMCLCCKDNRHYRAVIARALGMPYEDDDFDPDITSLDVP
jgi:hypothetical protein